MLSRHNKNVVIMAEGALCIALAAVLSKVSLFRMPQGGSINFELVPLMIFSYRRGLKHGLLAGALTGILKILLGGYVLNFVQRRQRRLFLRAVRARGSEPLGLFALL